MSSVLSSVLDTDTLSLIMRQNPKVVAAARAYLENHPHFTISVINRYEILRGLKAKGASAQLASFDRFCKAIEIVPVTDRIVEISSNIYSDLYRNGNLIGDADILIAATAISMDRVLVTNNEKHFRRIKGLKVVNWLK